MAVSVARDVAWDAGLVIASADPDGPPLGALTWPGVWIVTAQHPVPGTAMRRRGSVVVDFEERGRGGDDGDREPRNPLPPLDALHAERDPDEETDPDPDPVNVEHRGTEGKPSA
ncbi:hypothetical protein [Streptacidiphilus sp. PAMC 29251]